MGRAVTIGAAIRARADDWTRTIPGVVEARGRGLLQGVKLDHAAGGRTPNRALEVCRLAQEDGILLLAEGAQADVLAITPPAVITDAQLARALEGIERALRTTA